MNERGTITENESKNNPFSTKDIKITTAPITLYSLIDKLDANEIDLNPDFQRNPDLWKATQMSRLIESILLKLPLPVFYFDVKDDTKWIVVDGLQRLSTLKKFVLGDDNGKKLKLRNLEFLKHLNGKSYNDLDRPLQRIINTTQVITYQIEAQTPKEVRYSIFNRINTGGLILNTQEIRQALNQKNRGVSFLKELTELEVVKKVINQKSERMRDREVVLIFLMFKLGLFEFDRDIERYLKELKKFKFTSIPKILTIRDFEYHRIKFDKKSSYSKIQKYLDKAMEEVDSIVSEDKFLELKNSLVDSLHFIVKVFGNDFTFSLSIADKTLSKTFNQSLFDVITVTFSEIKDREKFLAKKDIFLEKFKEKILNEEDDFRIAITKGTSDRNTILTRFRIMRNLIDEVLNEY